MSDDVQVELMYLPRSEYADLQFVDGGALVDLFPDHVYIMGANDFSVILEMSPTLTPRMRDMFPEGVGPQWRLSGGLRDS